MQSTHLNLVFSDPLPSPQSILDELPISPSQQQFIEAKRQEVRDILEGKDPRLLLIVGPCSIHDTIAAQEYASKLQKLALQFSDVFCILMRVYLEKPRTGLGWKGFFYDPYLNDSCDIASGVRLGRQLLLHLAELGMAAGTEFLDPFSAYYYGDLITWGCIGARTTASQPHRQLASGLPMPIAFKNDTNGNVMAAANGILSASMTHTFIGLNSFGQATPVRTTGNPHGHLVLRGSENAPNYDPEAISKALHCLRQAQLPLRLLIDCSHDNALRQHEKQPQVFQSVIHQAVEGNRAIRGLLLEGNLQAGNQPFHTDPFHLRYGVSVTDECLDWTTTERLIYWGHAMLKREQEQNKRKEEELISPHP